MVLAGPCRRRSDTGVPAHFSIKGDSMSSQELVHRLLLGALGSVAMVVSAMPASAQGVVNVYSNREPGLYSATLDEFTKATGIKVNALFSEQGLAERIRAEGENGQ